MNRRELKRQLKSLRVIAPSATWLSAHRDVLLAQVRAQQVVPEAVVITLPWHARLTERVRSLQLMFASVVSAVAARGVAVAALVGVFTLASFGYVAAASQNVYPGDHLYPLKLTIESARLQVATSPRDRVALQIEFANRRLKELSVLMHRSGTNLPASETLVSQFETTVDLAATTTSEIFSTSPDKGAEIAKIVDEGVSQYEHVLKETSVARENLELARHATRALSKANRASTEALKVLVSQAATVPAEVATKIDAKIKNAEETLRLADVKLTQGGAKGGVKGGVPAMDSPEDKKLAATKDKSAVAKTNLAEAKKKATQGDYKAAVSILEGVADIVNDVAETAEDIAQAQKPAAPEAASQPGDTTSSTSTNIVPSN